MRVPDAKYASVPDVKVTPVTVAEPLVKVPEPIVNAIL
jgi:hypothetical protein